MEANIQFNAHVVNLYMHEIAIHVDQIVDDFRGPCMDDGGRGARAQVEPLTHSHIDALTKCVSATHSIIGIFMSFDVETVRVLPVLHFVRVAHAVVCLTKMYFAATAPNSELGKVVSLEDLKVEQCLDGLLDSFRAAAEGDRCKSASKFLMVLVMLKTWFQNPKGTLGGGCGQWSAKGPGFSRSANPHTFSPNKGESPQDTSIGKVVSAANKGDTTVRSATPRGIQLSARPSGSPPTDVGGRATPLSRNDAASILSAYNTANTPLQLLSEVAMGNSNGLVEGHNTAGAGGVGGNKGPTDGVSAIRFGTDGLTPQPSSSGWYGFGGSQGQDHSQSNSNGNVPMALTAGTLPPSTSHLENSISDDVRSTYDALGDGGSGANSNGIDAISAATMGDGLNQVFGMTLADDEFFPSGLLDDIFSFHLLNDGNMFSPLPSVNLPASSGQVETNSTITTTTTGATTASEAGGAVNSNSNITGATDLQ